MKQTDVIVGHHGSDVQTVILYCCEIRTADMVSVCVAAVACLGHERDGLRFEVLVNINNGL